MFCGKPTRERNAFDHSIVRHQSCRNEAEERNKAERSKREKIELIKRAIREVQAETPNGMDEGLRTPASTNTTNDI